MMIHPDDLQIQIQIWKLKIMKRYGKFSKSNKLMKPKKCALAKPIVDEDNDARMMSILVLMRSTWRVFA